MKIQKGIFNFYFNNFNQIIHGYPRSQIFAFILLALYYLQSISLNFGVAFLSQYAEAKGILINGQDTFFKEFKGTQNIDSLLSLKDSSISLHYYGYKLFQYSRIYPLIYDIVENSDELDIILQFSILLLNLTLITYPLLQMILLYLKSKSLSNEIEEDKQIKYNYKDKRSLFDIFIFFLLSIYRYILAIPFYLLGFKMIAQGDRIQFIHSISTLNLSLTFLIHSTLSFYDCKIQFPSKNVSNSDSLARSISIQSLISTLEDIAKCGVVGSVSSINQYFLVSWISLGFSLLQYIEFFKTNIFNNKTSSFMNFCLLNILTLFNLTIISFGSKNYQNQISPSLFIIIFIPILSVLSYHVFQYYERFILNSPIFKLMENPSLLYIFSKTLNSYCSKLGVKEYIYSQKGVQFESLFLSHQEVCLDSLCFCHEIKKDLDNMNTEKQEIRKKFIQSFIKFLYESHLKNNKHSIIQLRIQYIALLADCIRCPIKSNIQAIKLSNQKWKIMGLREKMCLNLINQRIDYLLKQISIGSSKIAVKRQNKQRCTESDLSDVIKFDSLYSKYQKDLSQIFIDMEQFYNLIASENVNLVLVKQYGEQIITRLDKVDGIINWLYKTNPSSKRCQELTNMYLMGFDMRKQRIKGFINIQKKKNALNKNSTEASQKMINLFSPQSCCLQISLLSPIGIVKRCTISIQKLFQISQQDLIGKSINLLIPQGISDIHNNILKQFIQEGQTQRLLSSSYLFFGKNQNNFIFPIKATMRFNMGDDFGISCFLSQKDTNSQFILLQESISYQKGRKSIKILNMSSDLYKLCFSSVFSSNKCDDQISEIDFYKMVPFLKAFDGVETKEFDFFQSILFFPQLLTHFQYFKEPIKMLSHSQQNIALFIVYCLVTNCGILDISFSLKSLSTKIGYNFKYIEIQSFKKIQKKVEKVEQLHSLIQDLNQILQCRISLGEDTLLNYLEFLGEQVQQPFTHEQIYKIFQNNYHQSLSLKEEIDVKMLQIKQIQLQSLQYQDIKNKQNFHSTQSSNQNEYDEEMDEKTEEKINKSHFLSLKQNDTSQISLQQNSIIDTSMIPLKDKHLEQSNLSHSKQSFKDKSIHLLQDSIFKQSKRLNLSYQMPYNDLENLEANNPSRNKYLVDNTSKNVIIDNITSRSMLGVTSKEQEKHSFNTTRDFSYQRKPKYQKRTESFQEISMDRFQDSSSIHHLEDGSPQNFFKSHLQKSKTLKSNDISKLATLGCEDNDDKNSFTDIHHNQQSFEKGKKKELSQNPEKKRISKSQNPTNVMTSITNVSLPTLNRKDQNSFQQNFQTKITNNTIFTQFEQNATGQYYEASHRQILNEEESQGLNKIMKHMNQFSSKQLNENQSTDIQRSSLLIQQLINNKEKKEDGQEKEEDEEKVDDQDDFGISSKGNEESNQRNERSKKKKSSKLKISKKRISLNQQALKEKEEERLDTHGLSSSSHSKSDMGIKKQVISSIMMKNQKRSMAKVIQIIGIVSFLSLFAFFFYVFFDITNNLTSMQDNGKVIQIGPGLVENTSRIISESQYIKMVELGIFIHNPSPSKFEEIKEDHEVEFPRILKKLEVITNSLLPFVHVLSNENQENSLAYFDSYGNEISQPAVTHLYSLFEAFQGLFLYFHLQNKVSTLFITENFIEIINIYDELRKSAIEIAKDSASTAQNILISSFFLILGIGFATVIIIFPIYRQVQISKEKNLKLFACFSREQLEIMQMKNEVILNSSILIGQNNHIKSKNKWKKRTIAQTTSLPRYNLYLSICCLVSFILILSYPIVNYLINANNISQLQLSIQEVGTILTARGFSAFIKCITYTRIATEIQNIQSVAHSIDQYLNKLKKDNEQLMQELIDIKNNFSKSSRHNQDDQKKYILDSLEKDMCSQFDLFAELNLQYEVISSANITSSLCRNSFDLLLQRGMILCMSSLFDIYYNFFLMANDSDFVSSFQFWDQSNNIDLFDDLQIFVSGAFESIALFQVIDMDDLFSFLQTLQIILLVYALFIIILLFGVGWRRFVSYVHSEINRTKYLFSLFPIDALLDNNYIASYLKKSSKNV